MSTHDLFQNPNYPYSIIRILKMISIFLVPLLDRTWFVCQRCYLKSFQQVDWWDQGQVTNFHWLKFLYIENWSKKQPIFSSLGFNTPWCETYQVLSFCSLLSRFIVFPFHQFFHNLILFEEPIILCKIPFERLKLFHCCCPIFGYLDLFFLQLQRQLVMPILQLSAPSNQKNFSFLAKLL